MRNLSCPHPRTISALKEERTHQCMTPPSSPLPLRWFCVYLSTLFCIMAFCRSYSFQRMLYSPFGMRYYTHRRRTSKPLDEPRKPRIIIESRPLDTLKSSVSDVASNSDEPDRPFTLPSGDTTYFIVSYYYS
jgi:hypothetical protein